MEKPPKLKRDWAGRRVRALRELRNGLMVIPAGAILTVDRWHCGLSLTGEPRACCGIRPLMSRVMPLDVELLPKE